MEGYHLRITQCIQDALAKVEGGDGAPQIQLNRRQCEYLAHELLKLSQFLQDREVVEEGIQRTALVHLHATVKRAQMLVETCCCMDSSWLATGITMGDTQEYFIAILLDLHQWKAVLDLAICALGGVSERAQLQQLWETGEERYQSLSKKIPRLSKMQNEIRDAARQDREELHEKIVNLRIEDQRSDDYMRGVYLKAWLNPGEGDLQNVEELKAQILSGDMRNHLGRGGSGSVFKGKWLGQDVALKIQEDMDPMEATVLGRLQHPNIIRLFHYWGEHSVDCDPRSCIVMELMPRDLQKHIVRAMRHRSKLPSMTREGVASVMPLLLPVAIDSMLQIAQAMRELHEKGLMHRDLKTSNILVKPVQEGFLELHDEGYLEVKLADFGSAKTDANTSQTADLTRNQGTSAYGAPEIFEKEKIVRERNFPPKADVWSFGMTCSEILTGAVPYAGEARPTLHARIRKDGLRPELPQDCPWYLQFCIKSCWELRPQDRPSFSDLCKMLRHAKLMSLGLLDVVDVKCLFWYQTSAGVQKSGTPNEEAKKSRSTLGAIWSNLRGVERSSKPQIPKPGGIQAEGDLNSQSKMPGASVVVGSAKSQESLKSESFQSVTFGDILTPGRTWRRRQLQLKMMRHFFDLKVKPTIYPYRELQKATGDFNLENIVGEGGFGTVYKGTLADGIVVAVKLFFHSAHWSIDDFLNEVVLLNGVKHQNLVKLKGCCLREDRGLLVFEFVDNYDLHKTLFEHRGNQVVTWPARFNICVGVAQGLHYLHELAHPSYIHRDIEANNILLDSTFHPKIAGCGLAIMVPDFPSNFKVDCVAGRRGYIAPEYAARGELSHKVDVYSFGVLALEVVSGRKNISFDAPEDQWYLVDWAWKLSDEGRLMEVVDSNLLIEDGEEGDVQRVLSTALACVQSNREDRPSMSQVLEMLQGKVEVHVPRNKMNEICWSTTFESIGFSAIFEDEKSQIVDSKLTIFDFAELQKATQNFHPHMKLGKGGFGAVFKGVLPDASVVVVTQLLFIDQKSMDEFSNEVALLTQAKHQNLVSLQGYCLCGDRGILVYEFVGNGNLAQTLFEHKGNQLATWPTRFNICLGVAQGLHYLHERLNPRIIHGDIKASNILLDVNLHPKIVDFGLAMLMPKDNIPHGTTRLIGGTRGYMAPKYSTLGQISDKVDVYSFGVLALEVVSGRRNISVDLP